MPRLILALCLCPALWACVRDTPDSRLDGDQAIDSRELAAMLKLDCSQRREEVLAARDDAAPDFDRIANYRMAIKAFERSAERIQAAFTREPDLLYLAEGDALRMRLQRCQAQAKTRSDELRKFEQVVEFKPQPDSAAEGSVESSKPPPLEPLSTRAKVTKKAKKSKTAVAKRKRAGRPQAVLADASH